MYILKYLTKKFKKNIKHWLVVGTIKRGKYEHCSANYGDIKHTHYPPYLIVCLPRPIHMRQRDPNRVILLNLGTNNKLDYL